MMPYCLQYILSIVVAQNIVSARNWAQHQLEWAGNAMPFVALDIEGSFIARNSKYTAVFC